MVGNLDVAFASYEAQLRPFVEANQEIGRWNSHSRDVPGPDSAPPLGPEDWDMTVIERAINGIELSDYAGVPDSGTV